MKKVWPVLATTIQMLIIGLVVPGSMLAHAQSYKVTLVARICPNYTDIMANRARNNIMQSLKDLGPNSTYQSGEGVSVAKENSVPTQVTPCEPLDDWKFTLGDGIHGSKDSGIFGELSKVKTELSRTPLTGSVPELNSAGADTGRTLEGAVTVTLSGTEVTKALAGTLVVQGGTPGRPLLGTEHSQGFAVLRCSIDNQNADNVEFVKFPGSVRHVFCYAYYVTPPPTAGTIIIKKQIEGTPPLSVDPSFTFGGDISFTNNSSFSLKTGQSTTFIRGADVGGTVWTITEPSGSMPSDFSFGSIACTVAGANGSSTAISSNQVAVTLKSGDKVTCTFTNRYKPPLANVQVSPSLGCVARSGPSSYQAYFGYSNQDGVTVSLPPGSRNYFSPGVEYRGQATSFSSGVEHQVFSVPFDGSTLRWTLNGSTVTATSSVAQRCTPTCLVPTEVTVASCDTDVVIDGSSSSTLNNGGVFSSLGWTTTCPGVLSNTNSLKPTLTLDVSKVTETLSSCTVRLKATDDTRYGSSDSNALLSDSCQVAVKLSPCVRDCAGIVKGTTAIDQCGVCGGNNSTCLDCAGIPNGGTTIDLCGVCGGDNSTCTDCAGIAGGTAVVDSCGVCGGDGSSCAISPLCVDDQIDACGVCNGSAANCLDCAGIANGKTEYDACGVCGGNGSSCSTCYLRPKTSAATNKQLSIYSADLARLSKIATRYGNEAKKCKPSTRQRVQGYLKAAARTVTSSEALLNENLRGSASVCQAGRCLKVSTASIKAELKDFGLTLRDVILRSKRIVAQCRKPIGTARPDANSSRNIYERMVVGVDSIPDDVLSCDVG